MQKLILIPVFILFAMSCSAPSSTDAETVEETETVTQTAQEAAGMNGKQLRHVVNFKFKESASAEDIAKVEQAFAALPAQIPQIRDFEWGTNNSPENLNKGFTHCFLVTFGSEEDRAAYLPHAAHKAFVEVLSPHLEDVMVIDYWAGE